MDERLEALKIGIPLQFLIKEKVLAELLGKIVINLKARTVLKGGTAINFAYLHKRFSEDLDFDCFSCEFSLDKVKVEGPRRYHSVLRYHYFYTSSGIRDNVRIEIRERKFGWEIAKKFVKNVVLRFFHGSIIANVPAYSLEFLAATKLKLISERGEGKDFFDLYWALKTCKPSSKEIEAIEILDETENIVEKAINGIKKANPRRLAIDNRYIPRKFRPVSWRLLLDELLEMVLEI